MFESDIPAIVALEREIFPDPWTVEAFEDSISFPACDGLIAEAVAAKGDTSPTELFGYACFYHAGGETHLTNIAVSAAS